MQVAIVLGLAAGMAAFLCTSGGSFINGQTIVVDGGWSSTKYLSEVALTSVSPVIPQPRAA